jgi:hypothetical protein
LAYLVVNNTSVFLGYLVYLGSLDCFPSLIYPVTLIYFVSFGALISFGSFVDFGYFISFGTLVYSVVYPFKIGLVGSTMFISLAILKVLPYFLS